MRIVGIDPSLRSTGVCILENGDIDLFSIKSSAKMKLFARQKSIVRHIQQRLQKDDIIVIEDFSVSARFAPSGRYAERIELCGMIKLVASAITRMPFLQVSPNLAKSFAAGKASAQKKDMIEAVSKKWNILPANDDEADACAFAKYAQSVLYEIPENGVKNKRFRDYADNANSIAVIRFHLNFILKNKETII